MKEINIEQATAVTSPDPLMLLCTTKENGSLNMAPVSFFMYSSYNPPMLAFAMGKESNSGSNIRRTGKAVFAAPGVSLNNAVMAYGSFSGNEQDKLKETPIVLQNIEEAIFKFQRIHELPLWYPLHKLWNPATITCIFATLRKSLQMNQKTHYLHGTVMRKLLRHRKNKLV